MSDLVWCIHEQNCLCTLLGMNAVYDALQHVLHNALCLIHGEGVLTD
jgi:hypothetical protein